MGTWVDMDRDLGVVNDFRCSLTNSDLPVRGLRHGQQCRVSAPFPSGASFRQEDIGLCPPAHLGPYPPASCAARYLAFSPYTDST